MSTTTCASVSNSAHCGCCVWYDGKDGPQGLWSLPGRATAWKNGWSGLEAHKWKVSHTPRSEKCMVGERGELFEKGFGKSSNWWKQFWNFQSMAIERGSTVLVVWNATDACRSIVTGAAAFVAWWTCSWRSGFFAGRFNTAWHCAWWTSTSSSGFARRWAECAWWSFSSWSGIAWCCAWRWSSSWSGIAGCCAWRWSSSWSGFAWHGSWWWSSSRSGFAWHGSWWWSTSWSGFAWWFYGDPWASRSSSTRASSSRSTRARNYGCCTNANIMGICWWRWWRKVGVANVAKWCLAFGIWRLALSLWANHERPISCRWKMVGFNGASSTCLLHGMEGSISSSASSTLSSSSWWTDGKRFHQNGAEGGHFVAQGCERGAAEGVGGGSRFDQYGDFVPPLRAASTRRTRWKGNPLGPTDFVAKGIFNAGIGFFVENMAETLCKSSRSRS